MLIDKASTADQVGKYAAKEIQARGDEVDEEFLKDLASQALKKIKELEPDQSNWQTRINSANRSFQTVFKNSHTKQPGYRWFEGGKKDGPKWKHHFLEFFTLGRKTKVLDHNPNEQPTKQPKKQEDLKPQQFLKTMTIEQLNLDTDTQQILKDALDHSGMTLEDFIKQSIKVYAKTIIGKAKQRTEDLANVSTSELLTDTRWKTHPLRVEELTKRAIRAIIRYNTEMATENSDRWKITQSAIASLTGSRPQAVGEILKQYQSTIDDHNSNPDYGFTDYSNRKSGRKITDAINLTLLVPDGLD